jgi:hypothetical protein
MCGRPVAFRVIDILLLRGYAPNSSGHSPEEEEPSLGKSETFRTSGGKAAKKVYDKLV